MKKSKEIYQSTTGEKYDLTELIEWIIDYGYEINDEIKHLNDYLRSAIESEELTSKGLIQVINSQRILIELNNALNSMKIESNAQTEAGKRIDDVTNDVIRISSELIRSLAVQCVNKSALRWFYETKGLALSNELSREIPEEVKNNLDFIESLLKAVNSLGKALNNQKEHDHSEIQ